eukprot:TRINITY_DN2751_c0_g1_i2.p2 TRINITY_DN2751_c0_g1~~TRINITY_DN2751_c0_g1_i2.p2  ORF type:complete len:267 (-),score=88.41 TRINITY_DN2751_c0_g1_i2:534-1334(-)
MSQKLSDEQLVEFAKGFKWQEHISDPVVSSALQSIADKYNNSGADDIANAPRLKFVVVGDGAVGKTSLLMSYCTGNFPLDYIPTVFENHTKQVTRDGSLVLLHLWDTAGQEEYDRLRPLSYPSSDIVIVAFSTVSPVSLKNVKEKWAPEIQHYLPDTPAFLVGTKVDLREQGARDPHSEYFSPVTKEMGEAAAKELGATYMEICAKTGQGLNELFEAAISVSLKNRGVTLGAGGNRSASTSAGTGDAAKGPTRVKKGKKGGACIVA